jgi:hypothetical protein
VSEDVLVLTSRQAWEVVEDKAPRGSWLTIGELYALVEANASLDAEDHVAISPTNSSPRWKRTVRNALQRRKASSDIEWDRVQGYRLP